MSVLSAYGLMLAPGAHIGMSSPGAHVVRNRVCREPCLSETGPCGEGVCWVGGVVHT